MNNSNNLVTTEQLEHYQNVCNLVQKLDEEFYYNGNDLGCVYTKEKSCFRLWAPTAENVLLKLYQEGIGDNLIESIQMEQSERGTWFVAVSKDLVGTYYTYEVTVNGAANEAVDPYARTTGVNGLRAMVIDLELTNPIHWEEDVKPEFLQVTDAVIYELHVRDVSSDESSNIQNVGKFLGLVESGTKSKEGLATGLDHMKELGITHLHLLPFYDYATVDETRLSEKQFNWGYDPQNYNVPEGSYSTDPYHGDARVKELKQTVRVLHENNIRVVMDVVYNHTYESIGSDFDKIVPNYYYRMDETGYTNGSGCGNEVASDHKMVRKFIVDSIRYWANEYHMDGFRFDLMGVLDCDTMNEIRKAVDEIDPSIILYGEGWTGGDSALFEEDRAIIANAAKLNNISLFNDRIRDAIKGSVFEGEECGYVNGAPELEEAIKSGVVGSIMHPEITFDDFWAQQPTQSINYVSAHDNFTLWDKLALSCPDDREEDRIKMNLLSAAIIFTSQGIPFFQAGEEFLRSKEKEDGTFDENSYKSDDSINSIKWGNKSKYNQVYEYYKGLIEFRKNHKELRMTTDNEIREKIHFINNLPENVVAYTINIGNSNDLSIVGEKSLFIIYNANKSDVTVELPEGSWNVYIRDQKAGNKVLGMIADRKAVVNPISALVLVRE